MGNPRTRTNFELLREHLPKDSLAQELLSAYTQASADQSPAALEDVLRKRFSQISDAISNS